MYRQIKFILLFILINWLPLSGQPVYFDKLYDKGEGELLELINRGAIIERNWGYLAYTESIDLGINTTDILLIKTNFEGDTIQQLIINDDTAYYARLQNFLTINDSSFIGLLTSYDLTLNNAGDYGLINFTESGEVVWQRKYGSDTTQEISQRFIKCSDKGYAIIGQITWGEDEDGDMYLVKTDSIGNFEWDNYYGGSLFEAGTSLQQTTDKGFLLLGWSRTYGAGERDWYLVKTDSMGNEEWFETYGDVFSQSPETIIELQDGNYLMIGGGGNGGGNATKGRMIKINQQGEVIWEKDYTYPTGTGSNRLVQGVELSDNSLVVAGFTNKASEGDAGWLVKTDSAGNLLWQRKYNMNQYPDLFYSVIQTSDNGFLLGGSGLNLATLNQDARLCKVDSMGCPYADCTVGIDEADNTKVVADIYPNPASELLNVEFQNVEDWLISLTDVNGKVVYTSNNDKETIITVNVSSFSAGVYLLQLTSEKSFVNKKIIIQH